VVSLINNINCTIELRGQFVGQNCSGKNPAPTIRNRFIPVSP
jgi:hypothetical protein